MYKVELDANILSVLRDAKKPLTTKEIVLELKAKGHRRFTPQDVTQSLYQRLAKAGTIRIDGFMASLLQPAEGRMTADEAALEAAVHQLSSRAQRECGCGLDSFVEQMGRTGALTSARALLSATDLSNDFLQLWSRNRLDLTIESLSLSSPWIALFSDEELTVAQARLRQPDPVLVLTAIVEDARLNDQAHPDELKRDFIANLRETWPWLEPCRRAECASYLIELCDERPEDLFDDHLATHVLGCEQEGCGSYSSLHSWAHGRQEQLRAALDLLLHWLDEHWACQPSPKEVESLVVDHIRNDYEGVSPADSEAQDHARDAVMAGLEELLPWRLATVSTIVGNLCERIARFEGGREERPVSSALGLTGHDESGRSCSFSKTEIELLRTCRRCAQLLSISEGELCVPSIGDIEPIPGIIDCVWLGDDRAEQLLVEPPMSSDWYLFISTVRSGVREDIRTGITRSSKVRRPASPPELDDDVDGKIERVVEFQNWIESRSGDGSSGESVEKVIREIMGSEIFDCLVPEARRSIVASELILGWPDFPDPNFVIAALARAFEFQLRAVVLVDLCSYLYSRCGLMDFPPNSQCSAMGIRPLVRGGQLAKKVMLGDVANILGSGTSNVEAYFNLAGFDLNLLVSEVRRVSQVRGQFVHEVPRIFSVVRQHRDQLLGVNGELGGVFRAFIPKKGE